MFDLLVLAGLVALIVMLADVRKLARQGGERLNALEGRLRSQDDRLDRMSSALARTAGPWTGGPTVDTEAASGTEPETPAAHPTAPDLTLAEPVPPPDLAQAPTVSPQMDGEPTPSADTAPIATPEPEPPEPAEPQPAESPTDGASPPPSRERGLTDLEQRFGTQWVVWVGGVALALGGIFLVRYSIEQGYFGPGLRVAIGAVLALLLVGAGEWTRRLELRSGAMGVATAHIPSILSAAGTTVAYATVYGAYALYGFVGPALAFLLLGIVALATLAAALVHGPMLAGLGLIGAYVTPLLVSTQTPNYWALYVYLTVVTASAFALARVRLWRWLAMTAAVFGIFWMLPGIGDAGTGAVTAHAFFSAAGFSLCAIFIVAGFVYGPPAYIGRIEPVSCGVLAGYLLTSFLQVVATLHDPIALFVFAMLAAATVAIALRTDAAAAAVPIAGAFAALILVNWATHIAFVYYELPGQSGFYEGMRPQAAAAAKHLIAGTFFAVLFGGGAFVAQGRSRNPLISILWAATGALTPIIILVSAYYRLYGFERSYPFAVTALVVAALYALATLRLDAQPPRPGQPSAVAIFACSAIASVALALTFALEQGWLTVALALTVPGIAVVSDKRPLPMLRWAIAVMVGVVLVRVMWNPRVIGADLVGSTPIFNWLLYGYGVPAVCFWVAGHVLRKRADDVPSRMTDSAAILFTVLLFTFEVRHLVYDGDVFRHATGLADVALQVSSALGTTIGLERTRLRTRNIVHDYGARILGTVAFVGIVPGLALVQNPMLTGEPVGGAVFNLVLLGYGLPAVLTAALARTVKLTRPQPFYVVAAVTAIVLALAYLTLEVRTLFHGPVLTVGATTDAEQYAYSATWLAFGVALLIAGVLLQSQPARLASAAVVTLTATKVFLYDLAGVQGAYRAFSFIGLGLVLMGIGWLYQRLLFQRPSTSG